MNSQEREADDIAGLLDQCSPDELANILAAIEGGLPLEPQEPQFPEPQFPEPQMITSETLVADSSFTDVALGSCSSPTPSSPKVLPPAGPPPPAANRRPVPAAVNRSSDVAEDQRLLTLSEARNLLENHSAAVATEVSKIVPCMAYPNNGGNNNNGIDLETLTKVLAARDEEVKDLEARLNNIQEELSTKDRRVADLGGELDLALREVRHRQLDLEFQQLKLDEMVRTNEDMEQAQKQLVSRVDQENLNARHAAIDMNLSRMVTGFVRVQGSLPWTVRKSRLPPSSGIL